MATIATDDLKILNKTYKDIEKECSQYGEEFSYLLATSLHLDPEVDLDTVLKLGILWWFDWNWQLRPRQIF